MHWLISKNLYGNIFTSKLRCTSPTPNSKKNLASSYSHLPSASPTPVLLPSPRLRLLIHHKRYLKTTTLQGWRYTSLIPNISTSFSARNSHILPRKFGCIFTRKFARKPSSSSFMHAFQKSSKKNWIPQKPHKSHNLAQTSNQSFH